MYVYICILYIRPTLCLICNTWLLDLENLHTFLNSSLGSALKLRVGGAVDYYKTTALLGESQGRSGEGCGIYIYMYVYIIATHVRSDLPCRRCSPSLSARGGRVEVRTGRQHCFVSISSQTKFNTIVGWPLPKRWVKNKTLQPTSMQTKLLDTQRRKGRASCTNHGNIKTDGCKAWNPHHHCFWTLPTPAFIPGSSVLLIILQAHTIVCTTMCGGGAVPCTGRRTAGAVVFVGFPALRDNKSLVCHWGLVSPTCQLCPCEVVQERVIHSSIKRCMTICWTVWSHHPSYWARVCIPRGRGARVLCISFPAVHKWTYLVGLWKVLDHLARKLLTRV